jgi:plasmid stability protein
MVDILVRKLDKKVAERLKKKATATGRSVSETARAAIEEYVKPSKAEIIAEIDRLRESIGPVPGDSTAVIREWRDRGWSDR